MSNLKKILVVDDERDFCRLMVMMLEREPYEIGCAHNLREASELLSKNHPEILLLDNNLPDGTGLDFAMMTKDLLGDSQIILITADASPNIKEKADEAGIHFLPKPFGLRKLRELIKTVA